MKGYVHRLFQSIRSECLKEPLARCLCFAYVYQEVFTDLIYSGVDGCNCRPIAMYNSNEADQLLCDHSVSNSAWMASAPVMIIIVVVGGELQVLDVAHALFGSLRYAKLRSRAHISCARGYCNNLSPKDLQIPKAVSQAIENPNEVSCDIIAGKILSIRIFHASSGTAQETAAALTEGF